FFFQAEDGIRDFHVTGVQTCALPILDKGTALVCPRCGRACPGYDSRERRWRHLDTCQFRTQVVAQVPRVQCPEHGCLTVSVPWAEQNSRYTLLFEAFVISWLRAASISAVSKRSEEHTSELQS